jgi:hypothetical protein
MTRLALLTLAALVVGLLGVSPGHAQSALYGYCGGSGQCVNNGTNSPTTNNPAVDFGFMDSAGSSSGDLLIDFLVPDNEDATPSTLSFILTGTRSGTANLVSTVPWTKSSTSLASYLALSNASTTNALSSYLPATKAYDSGATGYYVYQANLGTSTLKSSSKPNVSPLEQSNTALALGSYVVGFLSNTTLGKVDSWTATKNSGALFITTPPPRKTRAPEPVSLAILASGLLGLGVVRWRTGRS